MPCCLALALLLVTVIKCCCGCWCVVMAAVVALFVCLPPSPLVLPSSVLAEKRARRVCQDREFHLPFLSPFLAADLPPHKTQKFLFFPCFAFHPLEYNQTRPASHSPPPTLPYPSFSPLLISLRNLSFTFSAGTTEAASDVGY